MSTNRHHENYRFSVDMILFMLFYPRPPGIVVACVRPSVRPFVRAITHHPFKLGPPNLDHRCKRPCLRSLLFGFFFFCFFFGGGVIDLDLKFNFKVKYYPHFELVRAITHHPFMLGPPNLDQRCKIPWLRTLLFWGANDLDLQGQIWLKKSINFSGFITTGNK